MTPSESVRTSPLDAAHRRLGARLTDFGGWSLPLEYSGSPTGGTLAEHMACRTSAVAFDVSHLGTIRLTGPDAFDRLQSMLTNDLSRISPGRAQYTHLLADDGSVLDDIIVWWYEDAEAGEIFDVMPNASNTERVISALGGVDVTAERAVIAVQGPRSRELLATVFESAAAVRRFRVARCSWGDISCVVAGTGYTGEDGVEIAVPAAHAERLWDAIIGVGITPAGLGARDTLRLEAGLPLHGQELGAGITPLQAGLGWVVAFDKGSFRGRDALVAERERGLSRRLVGITVEGRRPPRTGYEIRHDGQVVGEVTSGNFSPVLGCGIALGFVPPTLDENTRVEIVARSSILEGRIVALPFVR